MNRISGIFLAMAILMSGCGKPDVSPTAIPPTIATDTPTIIYSPSATQTASPTGTPTTLPEPVFYTNPQEYLVEYSVRVANGSFTLTDLHVYQPRLVEWDSQRNVQEVSVSPAASQASSDPVYGNGIYFWKLAGQPKPGEYVDFVFQTKVTVYEIMTQINPEEITGYNIMTQSISFTPAQKNISKVMTPRWWRWQTRSLVMNKTPIGWPANSMIILPGRWHTIKPPGFREHFPHPRANAGKQEISQPYSLPCAGQRASQPVRWWAIMPAQASTRQPFGQNLALNRLAGSRLTPCRDGNRPLWRIIILATWKTRALSSIKGITFPLCRQHQTTSSLFICRYLSTGIGEALATAIRSS